LECLSKVNNFSFSNLEKCSVESFSIIEGRYKQDEIIKIKRSRGDEIKHIYSLNKKLSFKTSPFKEEGINKEFNKNISFIEDLSNNISHPTDNFYNEKKSQELNNYSIYKLGKIYDYLTNFHKNIHE